EVMERYEPLLNVCACAHLLSRSKQHPNPPRVDRIEEQLLGGISLGVVDKRDLVGGDARFDQLRTDIIVNIKSFRIGRRKIAKDQLGGPLVLSRVPNPDDAGNREINLGLLLGL